MAIKLGIILLCLLSLTVCKVSAEEAAPVLHRVGEPAMLTWKLPPSTADIISVYLQQSNGSLQPVLYCYKAVPKIEEDDRYKGRIQFLDSSIAVGTGVVTFTLNSVGVEDAGRYVCVEGFGQNLLENCGQMLVVLGKPQDVRVVGGSVALEGQDLKLQCRATSTSRPPDHNQPLTVQWFDSANRSLSESDDKVSAQDEVLTIRSVQRHDKGLTFSCRVTDGRDKDTAVWSDRSQPYTLVPQYPPRPSDILLDRPRAEIHQGDSLQLHCSATCNPQCTITWEKQQTPDNWYTVDSMGGNMNLSSAQRDQAGNFRCLAANRHGSAAQIFHLTVHYTPNIHQTTIDGKAGSKANSKEGTKVTLACQFDSSPAPTITWVKVSHQGQGHEIRSTLLKDDLQAQRPNVTSGSLQRSLYESRLVLGPTTCSDTGVYECGARNALGSGLDGEVDLHVTCMPRNTHEQLRLKEMYLLPAGNQVLIQFQVEGYPQPEVTRIISEDEQFHRALEPPGTWSVGKRSPPTEPYLTTLDLVMTKSITQYFDKTFYLDISNSEGTKTLAFKLREKGVPKPPRNVTAASTEDTSVLLQFIPGFHGGKPQNFLVQYQEAQSSEDAVWVTVPSHLQDTEEEDVQEVRVQGLRPEHSYNLRVIAHNEFGNSSSILVSVKTMATASASTHGGAIAGAVVSIIIILIIVITVVIFIFIIKPRQRKQQSLNDSFSERMLGSEKKKAANAAAPVEATKPASSSHCDSTNNNADRDTSTEPLLTTSQTSNHSTDDRPRNKDGLIYADLDLAKPKNGASKPKRNDAVNYEAIDFTRQAPPQPPPQAISDCIELASDDEELPSRK